MGSPSQQRRLQPTISTESDLDALEPEVEAISPDAEEGATLRLEDVYRRYYRYIYQFFFARNCTHEECKDLVQETFLRVCNSLEGFREEASLATWLRTVAESTYKNFVRARKSQKRRGVEIPIEDATKAGLFDSGDRASAKQGEPFRKLLQKERRSKLQRALNELPPRRRRCLLLRLTKDLKYREIADLMEVSIQTVKSHLNKAKEDLKAKLGEGDDDDWDGV